MMEKVQASDNDSGRLADAADLVKFIQEQDPSFDPNTVSDGRHPYMKVLDTCLYPETKAKVYAKRIEYQVLDTYKNLQWLLGHFNARVRNNLMKRRWEVDLPGHFIFDEDRENSAIEKAKYLATLNEMPIKSIGNHVKTIAEEHSYHPIVDCIKAKPWDGIARLEQFIDTLNSPMRDLTQAICRAWMCAAIASIFSPRGFVSQGVLVLQGDQKLGKTTWLKSLDPIDCGAVLEGANLDPTNKDDKAIVGEHWIVELGELDSTFKKDIARLKSYITSKSDHIRTPYAVKASHYYRRTVFAGSVNESTYLVDDTGNRRWWTVPLVKRINIHHGLDMQQVWAEVYDMWVKGHPTDLSEADQYAVNENNRLFEKVDPIKEKLLAAYDWSTIPDRELNATQVMEEIGYKANRGEATRCGKILTELTSNRTIRGITYHKMPRSLEGKYKNLD